MNQSRVITNMLCALLPLLLSHCKSARLVADKQKPSSESQPNSGASDLGPSTDTVNTDAANAAKADRRFTALPGILDGGGGETPLFLDFSRDQQLKLANETARFDINGDGYLERIDWPLDGGFVALDLNGNGTIDSGKELFGSATVDRIDFRAHLDGFSALEAYDADKNGIIDNKDPVFARLLIWTDSDRNAVATTNELAPLKQLISSLDIASARASQEVQKQSRIILRSTAMTTDGRKISLIDISFTPYIDNMARANDAR